MTLETLYTHLSTLNLPVTYYSFKEGKSPQSPYIVYFVPNSSNLSADGIVYSSFKKVNIELYTEKKDIKVERELENLLTSLNLFYNQTEDYIESERLLRQSYEVIINYE